MNIYLAWLIRRLLWYTSKQPFSGASRKKNQQATKFVVVNHGETVISQPFRHLVIVVEILVNSKASTRAGLIGNYNRHRPYFPKQCDSIIRRSFHMFKGYRIYSSLYSEKYIMGYFAGAWDYFVGICGIFWFHLWEFLLH